MSKWVQEEAKFTFTKGEYDRIKVNNKDKMGFWIKIKGVPAPILDNFVVFVGTQIYDIYKVLGNVNEFKRVRGIKDNDNIKEELNKLLQNESNKTFGLRTTDSSLARPCPNLGHRQGNPRLN